MTRKHRARSVDQIKEAAMQGTQFPCGTAADALNAGNHARYQELRDIMTAAWKQGAADAKARAGLYDLATILTERTNAIAAYDEVPAVEPAVSYLVGYFGALDDARIYGSRQPA